MSWKVQSSSKNVVEVTTKIRVLGNRHVQMINESKSIIVIDL